MKNYFLNHKTGLITTLVLLLLVISLKPDSETVMIIELTILVAMSTVCVGWFAVCMTRHIRNASDKTLSPVLQKDK